MPFYVIAGDALSSSELNGVNAANLERAAIS